MGRIRQQDIEIQRKRLAREQGTIRKDWGGRLPIALCYPNSYAIGMCNLGFQSVYSLLHLRIFRVQPPLDVGSGHQWL